MILASAVGNALYGAAFNTTALNAAEMPLFMNLVFVLVGALIAGQLQDMLGRIAWAVFALHHGIQALMASWGARIGSLWSLGFTSLFALLAAGSGASVVTRDKLLLAIGIFVVAAAVVFGARYYTDWLLGNHSVIR